MTLSDFMTEIRGELREFEQDWRHRQTGEFAQAREVFKASDQKWRKRLIKHLEESMERDEP